MKQTNTHTHTQHTCTEILSLSPPPLVGHPNPYLFVWFSAGLKVRRHPRPISIQDQPRGRILGRNPDKSHKSSPLCYSQSPLQLCLEMSISSISHNFLRIFSNSRNLLRFSTVKSLYTVKEKERKPDTVENHAPFPMVKEIHTET
jgi:hypothetical protein